MTSPPPNYDAVVHEKSDQPEQFGAYPAAGGPYPAQLPLQGPGAAHGDATYQGQNYTGNQQLQQQPVANVPGYGQHGCGPQFSQVSVGYVAPAGGYQQQQPPATNPGYFTQSPVVVVTQRYEQVENYCGHIALAMVVFMCCCCAFGMVAFALAGMACARASMDRDAAKRFGRASLITSIAGICVAILIIIIVVSVLCGSHRVDGRCYRHMESSGSSFDCSFQHFGYYYYSDGYCYWN